MRSETQGQPGELRYKCKTRNQQDWALMTYRSKKHKKKTKDQNLDDAKHTKGASERSLGLGGKTVNPVCQMSSF